jgi:hypothetical protein
VVHALNSSRDLRNERRKLRTDYLLEAYRKLEAAVDPRDKRVTRRGVESAIADIQLLGTPEQVRMAQTFAREIAESSEAFLNQLLAGLRTSLRSELQLEPVEGKILHLRSTDDDEPLLPAGRRNKGRLRTALLSRATQEIEFLESARFTSDEIANSTKGGSYLKITS